MFIWLGASTDILDGIQNFSRLFGELVGNCHDQGATHCCIYGYENSLLIFDNLIWSGDGVPSLLADLNSDKFFSTRINMEPGTVNGGIGRRVIKDILKGNNMSLHYELIDSHIVAIIESKKV